MNRSDSLLVSVLRRGSLTGHLYDVNLVTGVSSKVLTINSEDERAKHGGPHGLSRLSDGTWVVASYSSLLFYDSNYKFLRSFGHRDWDGIHGICADSSDKIWLTACNNDSVHCIDPNSGECLNSFYLRSDLRLLRYLSADPVFWGKVSRKSFSFQNQLAHPNNIFFCDGAPVVTMMKPGFLWNLFDGSPFLNVNGRFIHDGFVDFNNSCWINNTGACSVEVYDSNSFLSARYSAAHINSLKDVGLSGLFPFLIHKYRFFRSALKGFGLPKINWLRGFASLDAECICVGSSPASILIYDLRKGCLSRKIKLSECVSDAVFSIVPFCRPIT